MSWLFPPQPNNVEKLLEDPNTTLVQIFDDSSFISALRLSKDPIVNFIYNNTDNFEKTLKYAFATYNDSIATEMLNDKYKNVDKARDPQWNSESNKQKLFKKIQRSSVTALTMENPKISKLLTTNDLLLQKLTEFPNLGLSDDPKLNGYYCRILGAVIRPSEGQYLYKIPNLLNYLLDNIELMSSRELFIETFCEYKNDFIKSSLGVTEDLSDDNYNDFVKILLDYPKINEGMTSYYLFYTINYIFNQCPPDVLYFGTPDNFRRILQLAISDQSSSLSKIECFKVAHKIIQWSIKNEEQANITKDQIDEIVNEIEQSYNFINRPIDITTAFAARIFVKSAANLIDCIFSDQSNTFLNEAVLHAFKEQSWEDQLAIINKKNLIMSIIESISPSKTEAVQESSKTEQQKTIEDQSQEEKPKEIESVQNETQNENEAAGTNSNETENKIQEPNEAVEPTQNVDENEIVGTNQIEAKNVNETQIEKEPVGTNQAEAENKNQEPNETVEQTENEDQNEKETVGSNQKEAENVNENETGNTTSNEEKNDNDRDEPLPNSTITEKQNSNESHLPSNQDQRVNDSLGDLNNDIKVNGHITLFAEILDVDYSKAASKQLNDDGCKVFESVMWKEFVANVLKPHLLRRNNIDIVNTSDSDENEEEDVDEEEEEEEEEEEQLDIDDDDDDYD